VAEELPQDANFAGGRTHESGEKSQEGCLAGAVRTCNHEHLSPLEREVYAVENADSAERALQSANVEQR
jgi:hypothetical protein